MSDAPTPPEPADADGPPLPPPGTYPSPGSEPVAASDPGTPPPPAWHDPAPIADPPPIAPPPPIGSTPAPAGPPQSPPPPGSPFPGSSFPEPAPAGPTPFGGAAMPPPPRPPGYPTSAPYPPSAPGAYPPPGVAYPAQPSLGGPTPGSNGLAVAAMVVGILSIPALIACGAGMLGGLVAIGLGIGGLSRSKGLPGAQGKGQAITGIVTGVLALLLGGAFLVFALFMNESEINTDPSDGVCNESRFMQDPDC